MGKRAIRTAILGYGRSGGSMHAGAVEHSDDFAMTAVCDIDPKRRDEAAARFSCPVYEDYHDMLVSEALDLVCVITRSDQHCAMACGCLESGVNVLVTKPWAADAAEARRMIDAAAASGRLLLPWLPARWGCDLRRLEALLAEDAIGTVFAVRRAVRAFSRRSDWQTERRFAGGYILNWGPHIVDPPLLLSGYQPAHVNAWTCQAINPGDAEDSFFALITNKDGTAVFVEHAMCAEELPSWVVQGDRGTILVHGNRVTVHRKDPAQPTDPTDHDAMKAAGEAVIEETLDGSRYGDTNEVYAEIAAAVRGERPFPVSPAHALRLSEILEAIREAAVTHETRHV